jgi:hypothetical protein
VGLRDIGVIFGTLDIAMLALISARPALSSAQRSGFSLSGEHRLFGAFL